MQKWNIKKRIIMILIAAFPMLLGWQCNWPRYEFNWQTFRFERIGMRTKKRTKSSQNNENENGAIANKETETKIPKRGQSSVEELSSKEQRTIAAGRVYRLYLGKENPQEAIPKENFVKIDNAPVNKLAEILSIVYPGEGPGGRITLRFILYKDKDVWKQAKNFAKMIDLPIWKSTDTRDYSDWKAAIGMLYASNFPRKIAPSKRFKIISRLSHVISNSQENEILRWSAGIIIAQLNSQYEPRDFTAANANLSLSARIARGKEYQMLVVCYHQIKLLYLRRRKLQAKQLCQQCVNRFRSMENTECYQLVLSMLSKK